MHDGRCLFRWEAVDARGDCRKGDALKPGIVGELEGVGLQRVVAQIYRAASRAGAALSSLRNTRRHRFKFLGVYAVIATCTTGAASSGGKP